ncbi:unnamed protein product [Spodoptera littoralis]|uniref:Protein phosphatase 1 regulatory subunit 15A/B C-terminal domain-containing protein n=1 Tax=Spodoptera littoralis TaxID=7109 RepID=A0A9P0I9T6_SPOLI|nr:unnamed protein product [Spodoptera littoralis]CAH1642343.1 unnamed protein product [Spodoptera littoralis]
MNFAANRPDRRAVYNPSPPYSIANFHSETKKEMRHSFGEDIFLVPNNLHLIPDPLMKNLADTIITEEKMAPKSKLNSKIDVKTEEDIHIEPDYSPLSGITSFFAGVMNVITSAMFSKRKQADFVAPPVHQMAAPTMWHPAKVLDENKIVQDENRSGDNSSKFSASEMTDCKKAAAHCQSKLDQVRLLLGTKPVPCNSWARRRPKRVFVEASSVEDCFEDAFSPEDFENIAKNSYIEYSSPVCFHDNAFHEIDAPKVKTEIGMPSEATTNPPKPIIEPPQICETTEIVKNVPEIKTTNDSKLMNETKQELVASCEDKLSKLKALMQERKNKSKSPIPIPEPEPVKVTEHIDLPKPRTPTKVKDKRFKNPNRTCSKRTKSKMRKSILDDLQFANEICIDEIVTPENSPSIGSFDKYSTTPEPEKDYFDEVSGRFNPGSVPESQDSFQIVFNDAPKLRRTSDCESEDSFIVFEDSPDSCYTSNDVFGDSSDSEEYDSDSDDMSDSGCGNFSLAASQLSKSVNNLADDSLYDESDAEDEVDCANVTLCDRVGVGEVAELESEKSSGLLLDDRKKKLRRALPAKKVHFSEQPPKVHVMRVWSFAARQARAGHWERYALDRDRFKRRSKGSTAGLSSCSSALHRRCEHNPAWQAPLWTSSLVNCVSYHGKCNHVGLNPRTVVIERRRT